MIFRNFSQDASHIVTCERVSAVPVEFVCYPNSPIKKRAFRADFNGVVMPDGSTSDVLERSIGKHVETPAADAINHILRAPVGQLVLTTKQRTALCNLAGLFHANSPMGRERFDHTLDTLYPNLKKTTNPSPLVTGLARASAFDATDREEVAALEQLWALLSGAVTETTKQNASRLSIVWGHMTAAALAKMDITVLRIDRPPYWLLPDLPVLGDAPNGGDIPDPGSYMLFPLQRSTLAVFSTGKCQDSIEPAATGFLLGLYRAIKPGQSRMTTDWDVQASIAGNALAGGESEELYAHSVDDVAAMGKVLQVQIKIKSSPGSRAPGIMLPTGARLRP